MLNVADLGGLLAVIAGGLAGGGAAREHCVGWPVIFFVFLGLFVGFAVGVAGSKLAYTVLARSGVRQGQRETLGNAAFGCIYLLTPLLPMAVAAAATVGLTVAILSFTQ
jgi:hypothetical protein